MSDSRYPTESQRRILWRALTGLALAVIGALVVGIVYLLGNVLNYLQPVLVPLAIAGILAYLLNPVVEMLVAKEMSRLRAIIYVFALTTILLALGASLILPKLVQQTGDLIENREEIGERLVYNLRTTPWLRPFMNHVLARHESVDPEPPATETAIEAAIEAATEPTTEPATEAASEAATEAVAEAALEDSAFAKWIEKFPDWIPGTFTEKRGTVPFKETNLRAWLADFGGGITPTIKDWLTGAGKVFAFFGYALGLFLVPVYLFFFLKETATIQRHWQDFVPLKESNFKTEVVETLGEMNNYLIAFFRGQVLVSIIDGILTGLLLWMIGLPYAIVIGIALAILGVMPFIGFLITLIPALIIAATTWGDWQHPLLVLGIFFVVQQIDGFFIQPKIIGDKVGLHPMTIIFSIFFWSFLLGGFLGALLAVPLTASVKVLFTRYLWENSVLDRRKAKNPKDPPPDSAAHA